ncbi:MAG: thermonuclease family protein [Chloroflexota bacterium]|nr:thermonuclease family protein [Chloroflexota bacterium]
MRIAQDPTQDTRDKYGRLLVYVWTEEGVFYNQRMIRDGFAHEYTYQVPYFYQQQFESAQAQARAEQKGFWSPATCAGDTKQPAEEATPTPKPARPDPTPTPEPDTGVEPPPSGNCDPNYEGACIPPYSQGDVDCGEIEARDIRMVGSDPHRLDGSPKDGIGCES